MFLRMRSRVSIVEMLLKNVAFVECFTVMKMEKLKKLQLVILNVNLQGQVLII